MVPDLGDFSDVEIVEMHIQAGDSIGIDDPILHSRDRKSSDGYSESTYRQGHEVLFKMETKLIRVMIYVLSRSRNLKNAKKEEERSQSQKIVTKRKEIKKSQKSPRAEYPDAQGQKVIVNSSIHPSILFMPVLQ